MSDNSTGWARVVDTVPNLRVLVERRRNVPEGEPGWVWSARSFMGTRDIEARGYRHSQADATAAGNEAAILILRLRMLEAVP